MAVTRAQADESNAYIPDGPYIEGSPTGPLRGLTFAVKDLFDVRCPCNTVFHLEPLINTGVVPSSGNVGLIMMYIPGCRSRATSQVLATQRGRQHTHPRLPLPQLCR